MRLSLALGLVLSALVLHAAQARPFTVEDLLKTEGLGRVMFDPPGRWLVLEHRRPWREAASFDLNVQTLARLSRLEGVDTQRPGPAHALFPQEAKAGYLAGPFAPDGRHLLVYRLRGRQVTAGVLDLARRKVVWLKLTPEQPVYGRAAQWRSNHELVLIARPDGDLPRQFALGWKAGQRSAQQAALTAAGRTPSGTRWGSGRFLDLKPARAPSRLLVFDLATGRTRTLARGEFVDLELSPDGRWAALLQDREQIQPTAQDRVYVARPSRRRTLALVDLETGRLSRPCDPGDVARNPLSWSPDSRALLVALRRPDTSAEAWDARELVRVDPTTGACSAVALGGLLPVVGHSSEDNPLLQVGWRDTDPLVLARPGAARPGVYRLTPTGPVNLTAALPTAPTGLALLDPRRLVVTTTAGLWQVPDPTSPPASLSGRRIGNPEAGGSRVIALPATGPLVTWAETDATLVWHDATPTRRTLDARSEPLAATAQAAAILTRSPNGQMRLDLLTRQGRRTPALALNAAYRDITPAKIAPIPHAGPRGQALTSWLYLPPTQPPGQRLPLVVIPYRGAVYPRPPAEQALGAWNDWANAQILAGAGYAVLIPSLPYDATTGEPAARMADDILRAVDAALARGDLDPDRIGLLGQSFGAFSAVAAAEQSPRFKSVVASAGAYDQISLWGIFPQHQALVPEDGYSPNLTNGLVEQGQTWMGAPPWVDPTRYIRNSPLFAADQITAPVLILHGQTDELGAFQAQELFSALYRQGKDAQLVVYGAEGHTTSSPANIADKWAIILDWLAQTLGPPAAVPPSPSTPAAKPQPSPPP